MERLDRGRFLGAGFDVLCETGVGDVRISTLCARLGVTKGSFYWHFESREALLHAMLDQWEGAGTEAVITAVEAKQHDPAERLRLLLHTVFAESPRTDRIEAAIRAWAAADPQAAATVARVDARRLAYVRGLLEAMGAPRAVAKHRAALLYRALIGEFTWRAHGGAPLGTRALAELHRMLVGA